MNLPVEVILKNKKGKICKNFSVLGPRKIDQILLWIWRDLFVSLYANGTAANKSMVPNYLEDIELSLGVDSLEKLLFGGRPGESRPCSLSLLFG